jgi:hypothetical protein
MSHTVYREGTRGGLSYDLLRSRRLLFDGSALTVGGMFRRRCIVQGCRERRFPYQQVCDWHLGVERTAWREEGLPEPSPYEEEYRWLMRRLNELCGRDPRRTARRRPQ